MSKEANTNPCRDVKPLPGEQPRTRYLLPDQEKRLMDVLSHKPPYLAAIVALAINTGMRRGEILRLEWDQVDFFREEIKAIKTKNGHDRPVPMNATVKAVLLNLRETSQSEFLFPSPRKNGSRITYIRKSFNTALAEAGIKNFRFHDLRHTFGTRAADGGVEMTAIAEVMGHADIRTTRRYSHATDQGRRRAVEAVERNSTTPAARCRGLAMAAPFVDS
jgi:integrase